MASLMRERLEVRAYLECITQQQISLENWWGPATSYNPRLAYERFIDTIRLLVDLVYTRDGDAVGLFAAKATGDERKTISFLVDFLRAATRRDKLMPFWWNPQHDIAMFRLALDEEGDFYVNHAVEVSDIRKKWGYRTTKLLTVLAITVYGEGNLLFRHDQLLHNCCLLYLRDTPQRETGFEDGVGKACRYGMDCKRHDCWFQHPRIGLTKENDKDLAFARHEGEVCSTTNMYDHILQMVGNESTMRKYYELYTLALGIAGSLHGGSMLNGYKADPEQRTEAQKELQEIADSGNPFVMYLLGKVWTADTTPILGKLKSEATRNAQTIKLWTASALAGNAYPMAGLALRHRDAGHMPTAVQWWKRSLRHAEYPEAAYDLGVAYGLNETPDSDRVPINYEEAAKYYSMVADMDLGYMKVSVEDMALSDEGVPLARHVLDESPANIEQLGFQHRAKANLLCLEKYLGNPSAAPLENHKELSPFVEDGDDGCLLCGRFQRVGEKTMMKCSRCHSASYCNSICQRGHWPTHKPSCAAQPSD